MWYDSLNLIADLLDGIPEFQCEMWTTYPFQQMTLRGKKSFQLLEDQYYPRDKQQKSSYKLVPRHEGLKLLSHGV